MITKSEKVAIYGAGKCGHLLYKTLKKKLNYKVSCFIDDDPKKRFLFNLSVYKKEDFIKISRDINKVIIAIPSIDNFNLQKIINFFIKYKIEVLITPDLWNIKSGFDIDNFYEIDPYLVLDREPLAINQKKSSLNILKKNIVVFGGAGSIGREVCHQCLGKANKIFVLDNNEFNLFNTTEALNLKIKEGKLKTKVYPHLCNLEDKIQFENIFRDNKVDIAYNAAAYKHVISGIYSSSNLIYSNIKTCINTFEICQKYNVKKYLYISTDKAAEPKSHMGLSKFICEEIVNPYNLKNSNMSISKVRFGNVFGSMGSAIPIFLEQIKKGRPVTIRDKNLYRYFLSIPEAAQLILISTNFGKKGEIYAFDMGKPISIVKIVKRLIQIYSPANSKIKIQYGKLLKSEKIKEKLTYKERSIKTNHQKIFKIVKRKNKGSKYHQNIYEISKKMIFDEKNFKIKTYLNAIKKIGISIK